MSEIVIERATLAETDLLIEIHEDVARWLWSRGIRQWEPGTFPRERLIACIERGEVYLVRLDDVPVGMAILQEADEYTWGARLDDALYLHGLRVLRAYAGRGIGRAILRWAEEQVTTRGRIYLRLDCMADNAKLRAYYEDAGFRCVGEKAWEDDPSWRSSLHEKRVAVRQAE
ncbi:MAG TPA: GNAT family N-acetyltransferase [Ktedonobacterales bacterium]|nr:GNAT family N-acetyltransferase [Ktedonobacterales bacterium]